MSANGGVGRGSLGTACPGRQGMGVARQSRIDVAWHCMEWSGLDWFGSHGTVCLGMLGIGMAVQDRKGREGSG